MLAVRTARCPRRCRAPCPRAGHARSPQPAPVPSRLPAAAAPSPAWGGSGALRARRCFAPRYGVSQHGLKAGIPFFGSFPVVCSVVISLAGGVEQRELSGASQGRVPEVPDSPSPGRPLTLTLALAPRAAGAVPAVPAVPAGTSRCSPSSCRRRRGSPAGERGVRGKVTDLQVSTAPPLPRAALRQRHRPSHQGRRERSLPVLRPVPPGPSPEVSCLQEQAPRLLRAALQRASPEIQPEPQQAPPGPGLCHREAFRGHRRRQDPAPLLQPVPHDRGGAGPAAGGAGCPQHLRWPGEYSPAPQEP